MSIRGIKLNNLLKESFPASFLLSSLCVINYRKLPFEFRLLFPNVNFSTLNAQTIFAYGNICYGCGRVGSYAAITRSFGRSSVVFIIPKDKPKLITADHIVPLSRCGTNAHINIQPFCEDCNQQKHDLPPKGYELHLVTQRKKVMSLFIELRYEEGLLAIKSKSSTWLRNPNNITSYHRLCEQWSGMELELLNLCKKMV